MPARRRPRGARRSTRASGRCLAGLPVAAASSGRVGWCGPDYERSAVPSVRVILGVNKFPSRPPPPYPFLPTPSCSRPPRVPAGWQWRPPAGRYPPLSTLSKPRRRLMRGWPIMFRTTYEASSVRRTVIGPLFSTPQGGGGGGGRDGPAADTHYTRTLPKNAGRSERMVPHSPLGPPPPPTPLGPQVPGAPPPTPPPAPPRRLPVRRFARLPARRLPARRLPRLPAHPSCRTRWGAG